MQTKNVIEETIDECYDVHKLDSMRKWINDNYDMNIKPEEFIDAKTVRDKMISVIERVFYKDYKVKTNNFKEFIGHLKTFRLDNIDSDERINYVYLLQILLNSRGYKCGFNGLFDNYTRSALRNFYTDNHIYGINLYTSNKNMYIFRNFLNKENTANIWVNLLTWSTSLNVKKG